MIDIHCHILPEVDDGPKNIEKSIEMLKAASNNNVDMIVVTPHFKKYDQDYLKLVVNSFITLKEIANKMNIELFLGSEIMYSHETARNLKRGLIPSINNTKYILVEFPVYLAYSSIHSALYDLISSNYIPILAHVERYLELDFDKVKELSELGVVIQVNSKTITLGSLNKTYRFINKLISNNLVQIISSDAHNNSSRVFLNTNAAKIVAKKFGIEKQKELFTENALKIIKGEIM